MLLKMKEPGSQRKTVFAFLSYWIAIQLPIAVLLYHEDRTNYLGWFVLAVVSGLAAGIVVYRHKKKADRILVYLGQGKPPKPLEHSGKIWMVEDNVIHYERPGFSWELPVTRIRLLGEYTNQDGPYADDYFFVFATGPDRWYEASFYAEGSDSFLNGLSGILGHPLKPTLTNSTDFHSNVLWPAELAGRPLFDFKYKRRSDFWGKWCRVSDIHREFSPHVLKTLKR
ncbi:MAG: hypothetical protein ACYTEX_10065 [Planctomycetota bacterium]|jgi:hypothetical protein